MTVAPEVAVDIRPIDDFDSVAPIWRALEARGGSSFFQSWAWTGCLPAERFDEPWLLSARRGDEIIGLGLFNRGPRAKYRLGRPCLLGESGDPRRDTIFIEHNGLLLDPAEPPELMARCWAAVAGSGFRRSRWVLSGVPAALRHALPPDRTVRVTAERPAPYLDFSQANGPVLDRLSANTRQQLRRSLRAWESIGSLTLDVAATPAQAGLFLDGLKSLHQSYWIGRGKPGAFAEPFFEHFHRALIKRAGPGQSVDLIRVSAGDRIVGYLYNFVHYGWVASYQSGFDFGPDADRLRPGLICHLLAIEHYRRAGMRLYDFLGGDTRYKRSFANAEITLLWLDARRRRPWPFGRRADPSTNPQT